MRVLITGNMGYVGPIVVQHLRRRWPTAELVGFDSGLFGSQIVTNDPIPERLLDRQIWCDIRDVQPDHLSGVDSVVHLSAISNDPMGSQFEAVTEAVNYRASVRLARIAAEAGVETFVFASSCSVYGAAGERPRREDDSLNPLTAYARSKIDTEEALRHLSSEMTISCLRFATARGMSPRLRLDLVLNDFVASAVRRGQIDVLSDGSPWRPLIDVADMALAIEWALQRPAASGGRYLAVNVGADEQNYTIAELAAAVAEAVPGTEVSINKNAQPDGRSYRVDFGLYRRLAPQHQPLVDLGATIANLKAGLAFVRDFGNEFRGSDAFRLFTLERHIAAGRLDSDVRWIERARQSRGGEKDG